MQPETKGKFVFPILNKRCPAFFLFQPAWTTIYWQCALTFISLTGLPAAVNAGELEINKLHIKIFHNKISLLTLKKVYAISM